MFKDSIFKSKSCAITFLSSFVQTVEQFLFVASRNYPNSGLFQSETEESSNQLPNFGQTFRTSAKRSLSGVKNHDGARFRSP